ARFTGFFAGACVAAFITFEAPISGMSMNPARTFGSAVLPQLWDSLWIYFLAPPLGMLAAAAVYLRLKHAVGCAKLHHQNKLRCIFCEYQAARRKEIQLHKPGEMSLPLARKEYASNARHAFVSFGTVGCNRERSKHPTHIPKLWETNCVDRT